MADFQQLWLKGPPSSPGQNFEFFYFSLWNAEKFHSGGFGHGEHDGDIKNFFYSPGTKILGGQNFNFFYFLSWSAENFVTSNINTS